MACLFLIYLFFILTLPPPSFVVFVYFLLAAIENSVPSGQVCKSGVDLYSSINKNTKFESSAKTHFLLVQSIGLHHTIPPTRNGVPSTPLGRQVTQLHFKSVGRSLLPTDDRRTDVALGASAQDVTSPGRTPAANFKFRSSENGGDCGIAQTFFAHHS